MSANCTGRQQAILSASDAALSQEFADGKISIQLACALNTRYNVCLSIKDPAAVQTLMVRILKYTVQNFQLLVSPLRLPFRYGVY
jgi:hypothetical protein